ncbi:MAG: hypothetical protein IPG68_14790 [Micrococcales bacterium]|nr:hypothetical protein [Micrococcales bacterium]
MDARLTWAQAMAWTHEVAFSPHVPAHRHFTTSIDLGDHVARLVLQRCRAAAARHGIDRPWIVDVGAGGGRLLRQLQDLGFPADRLIGVDVRPRPELPLPVRWIQGRAPDCLPQVEGLVFAHEFLDDIPADVVHAGRTLTVAGRPGPAAQPGDLQWAAVWGDGPGGRRRDEAWSRIVSAVSVGEAIAVDYPRSDPVGHRAGRRVPARPDGGTDISAGVEFRALRARAGGRIVPQHRILADAVVETFADRAELAVLRDRSGLGAFQWLITDRPETPPGRDRYIGE